ncbi:tRNA (guanosine(46)-N7)-methyltransferase TrmB [Buchnera aphidicola (Takecallis taiwana)]|uniref:tRNA (guanosine(46)-N7)-methyltransferase TrmB n=1 Tax=Buchnera aphidicola TaxID=9 RepID=UPI0031B70B82
MKNIITNNFITPSYNKKGIFLRTVHSFKLRMRPLNEKIIYILKRYWIEFGINFQHKFIDLNDIFIHKRRPIILEIGFGDGKHLFYTAVRHQSYNYLGVEVYLPGIANIMKQIHDSESTIYNLKIIAHDVVEVLKYMIKDHTLNVVQIFFPDPWPKTCHHKRRILNKSFIILLAKKIIYNGILHIITDCILYAQYIINMLNNMKNFVNISNFFHADMLEYFIKWTKFGCKAAVSKKKIFNLIFQYKN